MEDKYKHNSDNTYTKKDIYSSGLQQPFSILSFLHTHSLETQNQKINKAAYGQMKNSRKKIFKLFWKVRFDTCAVNQFYSLLVSMVSHLIPMINSTNITTVYNLSSTYTVHSIISIVQTKFIYFKSFYGYHCTLSKEFTKYCADYTWSPNSLYQYAFFLTELIETFAHCIMQPSTLVILWLPEAWTKVHRHVSMPLLESLVLFNVVQVVASDHNCSLHFHFLDNTCQNASTDGHVSCEGTFLVNVGSKNCLK